VNMSKNKSPGSDGLTTEFYCKSYGLWPKNCTFTFF
jgi:hypothetical protein